MASGPDEVGDYRRKSPKEAIKTRMHIYTKIKEVFLNGCHAARSSAADAPVHVAHKRQTHGPFFVSNPPPLTGTHVAFTPSLCPRWPLTSDLKEAGFMGDKTRGWNEAVFHNQVLKASLGHLHQKLNKVQLRWRSIKFDAQRVFLMFRRGNVLFFNMALLYLISMVWLKW